MNTTHYSLIAALLMAGIGNASAETMRCANSLVDIGDRAFEVQQKCGAPLNKAFVGYGQGVAGQTHDYAPSEEWIYQPEGGMQKILTFEGSRLVRIESRRPQ